MKQFLFLFSLVLLMPFYANAGCEHELCEQQRWITPDVSDFSITGWKDGRMSFKVYSYNYLPDFNIRSNGRDFKMCRIMYLTNEGGCAGMITGQSPGWVTGWVDLPRKDKNVRPVFSDFCRCAKYRDPTVFERLQGISKTY